MQTLKLTALQINTFMVFSIVGAVIAVVQLIVAADGASTLDEYYERYLPGSRRCRSSTFCKEVSHFSHAETPATRMWADAQRDGRPAEYRWRPLRKFRNSILSTSIPSATLSEMLIICPMY